MTDNEQALTPEQLSALASALRRLNEDYTKAEQEFNQALMNATRHYYRDIARGGIDAEKYPAPPLYLERP